MTWDEACQLLFDAPKRRYLLAHDWDEMDDGRWILWMERGGYIVAPLDIAFEQAQKLEGCYVSNLV